MTPTNPQLLTHFNTPGPQLEEWCRAHITPQDYAHISSSYKGLSVFLEAFPYVARAIQHKVRLDPYWWDEWSHPNFAADMLKYSKDPSWVPLLRFHWDERWTPPMRDPHAPAPFPKHTPSPPKLSTDPNLPILILDQERKNVQYWRKIIEYSLNHMDVFTALMDEIVLRQTYQNSHGVEALALSNQHNEALAIVARHQDTPANIWREVLFNALRTSNTPLIMWMHSSPDLKAVHPFFSSWSVGLSWTEAHPSTKVFTDPKLSSFWQDMQDNISGSHPSDQGLVSETLIKSLRQVYVKHGAEAVSTLAPLVLPLVAEYGKLFPHLNMLIKDRRAPMDLCDRLLPYFSTQEKELICSLVQSVPTHALSQSTEVTKWLLTDHTANHTNQRDGRIKKM